MPRPSLREDVVAAAMEQFHRHGYQGGGVKDITSAAGLPKGSFYNYFASKEEIPKCWSNGEVVEYWIGAPKARVNSPTTMAFQVLVPERSSRRSRPVSGSTGPGQGAGVADVEVVSHDLRAGRKDRRCSGTSQDGPR